MANLTLSIPDDVLRRARIRALQQDTSVNALVKDYLERLAGDDPAQEAINDLLARAAARPVQENPTGIRTWGTREEWYEDQ